MKDWNTTAIKREKWKAWREAFAQQPLGNAKYKNKQEAKTINVLIMSGGNTCREIHGGVVGVRNYTIFTQVFTRLLTLFVLIILDNNLSSRHNSKHI